MSQMIVQFRRPGGQPTAAQAAETIGLAPEDLDSEFGVIATDPSRDLYAVRVAAEAAGRARVGDGPDEGSFSDPKMAPFGPL